MYIESEMVRALSQGSEEAFTAIYNAKFYKLHRFACSFLTNEEAMDVCTDVFMKLWQIRFESDQITNIDAFLIVSTRNGCISVLRSNKNKSLTRLEIAASLEHIPGPDKKVEIHSIFREVITRKMDLLPKKCRRVFELFEFEGLSYSEIADALNISVHTVKAQRFNAYRLLKKMSNISTLNAIITFLIICSILNTSPSTIIIF